MDISAHDRLSEKSTSKLQVFLTDAGSYLGVSLAQALLLQNCEVFGVGNSVLLTKLLSNHNFTLLELDLNQPLPRYLPKFDIIFYQDLTAQASVFNNIATLAKENSKIVIFAPVTCDTGHLDNIVQDKEFLKLTKFFLIGDLYGPEMPLRSKNNHSVLRNIPSEFGQIISQAVTSDKIILENEGLNMIYPTYITDAVFAIIKLVFSKDTEKLNYIVSQDPKTALSVSYIIQNIINVTCGKQVGLFFSGPQPTFEIDPEPVVKIGNLGFTPKVELEEGLAQTFEYFKLKGLIESRKPYIAGEDITDKSKEALSPESAESDLIGDLSTIKEKKKLKLPAVIVPKIPQSFLKFRLRMLFLAFLVILFLVVDKTAVDNDLGLNSIKNAKKAVFEGDFERSQKLAQSSSKSFKAAYNKSKIITYPLKLIFPKKTKSFNLALSGVQMGGVAFGNFLSATKTLANDFKVITSDKDNGASLDLENPLADFKRAYFVSSLSLKMVDEAKEGGIFKPQIESAAESISSLNSVSASSLEMSNFIVDLIGVNNKKNYLVLLLNNTELRPGGGFIGNWGLIQFENSKLKQISVEDIYTIDGQLKEIIEPPKELKDKLGVGQFYLRDSNWSGVFKLDSATARDFFKKETGKEVDGVIAIDLNFIQELLEKTGPIKLGDYNEEITSKNLFEKGEYYSEVGFFPGSTQKRDFFGALTKALVERVLENQQALFISLMETVRDGLLQKHLMVSFDGSDLSTFIRTKGWDNLLPPVNFNPKDDSSETRDFLAVIEANLGANKVNRFLESSIKYEMTIGRDADLVAKLKISYKNNSQADTWPSGKYVNFLRVYVPYGSDLIGFEINPKVEKKATELKPNLALKNKQEE